MIIKITNAEASIETDYSIDLKTTRYYDSIRFVTECGEQDVKLACLIGGNQTPASLINIRSYEEEANRFSLLHVRTGTGLTFSSPTKAFEFTDNPNYWYVYEFTENPLELKVYKEARSRRLLMNDYELRDNLLYHNYRNTYDAKSGAYTVYQIVYSDSSGSHTKVLETKNLISEIGLTDIEEDGSILPYKKRFLREQVANTYFFSFYNTNNRFFYKASKDKLISEIDSQTISDSIYLAFDLTDFSTVYDSITYNYLFPEAATLGEEFDSSITYRMVTRNLVKVFGGSLIDRESSPLEIQVLNETGDLLTSYSNYGTNPISMIDYKEGFLYLPMAINPSWTLQISGIQNKTAYLYDSLDLNPSFNENFINESSYLFYWKPNDSSNGIHWIQFYNGKSIECSDESLRLISGGFFNPTTIVGLEYDAITDELSNLGNNSYRYIFLKEVSYKKPPASIEMIDIHERQILSSDFDYVTHHQVSLTDGVSEQGLEYPLNNSIVVNVDYDILQEFTETEIKAHVAKYATPGKVVQLFNPQDPIVESYLDRNGVVTISLTLSNGESYSLWKEETYLSGTWNVEETDIVSSPYSLQFSSPTIGSPNIQRYKLTIQIGNEPIDTNFLIEVMETP